MQLCKNPNELIHKPLPKSDLEELREHFQFLLPELAEGQVDSSWQMRMLRMYHERLFKEFCLCDLSLASSEHRVAMRWRVESEVISGKGQFECGNVHCTTCLNLSSYEVNFGYFEQGTKKNALVKLVLCSSCAELLKVTRRTKQNVFN